MERVEKVDGHWLWTGKIGHDGYGSVSWESKPVGAHRVFYQQLVGPIPEGFEVDHIQDDDLCGIRHCVNPEHLRAVTHRQNMLLSSSFVALKAQQTHCIHGHEFTLDNTRVRTNGTRACRTCERARHRRAYLRSIATPSPETEQENTR